MWKSPPATPIPHQQIATLYDLRRCTTILSLPKTRHMSYVSHSPASPYFAASQYEKSGPAPSSLVERNIGISVRLLHSAPSRIIVRGKDDQESALTKLVLVLFERLSIGARNPLLERVTHRCKSG